MSIVLRPLSPFSKNIFLRTFSPSLFCSSSVATLSNRISPNHFLGWSRNSSIFLSASTSTSSTPNFLSRFLPTKPSSTFYETLALKTNFSMTLFRKSTLERIQTLSILMPSFLTIAPFLFLPFFVILFQSTTNLSRHKKQSL